ncbi:MAG: hypothetical protein JSU72_02750 [Deltaproteobacteria bacterium]|nr:MAG: hypothetical protein JSU72_02750 [Deltaproteobacteria bacterium]
MHSNNSRNRKLRFMELMQRCLPFKWQKYWNCGTKEFDLLMLLQDIDNLRLSVQDRLLLTLLARICTGKGDSLGEVKQAVRALGDEQREIVAQWMEEQQQRELHASHASACPSCAGQVNSSLASAQKRT